jgi:hypothetical protein
MAKDENQKNITKLEKALKEGKAVAKRLEATGKQLQDLRKQSKQLLKK